MQQICVQHILCLTHARNISLSLALSLEKKEQTFSLQESSP